MTPEQLAYLHARAFVGQGRAWSAAEFSDLLQSPHVHVLGDQKAFALGRIVVGEAELLTLACDPEHRRQGHARDRLSQLERAARVQDAERLFLEVSSDNTPAIRLYEGVGFGEIARRKGYYETSHGRVDAIVMEKRLD